MNGRNMGRGNEWEEHGKGNKGKMGREMAGTRYCGR